jgi:hypothetical protein
MAHIGKLSTLKVAALIKAGKTGRYGDGGNLYLQVTGTSSSWIFRYKVGRRLRDAGLGSTSDWTLKQARERARKFRQLRADGIDPIEQRRAQRAEAARAMTFRQCAETYVAAHRAGWRNPKHAGQWSATLQAYVYPIFGDLSVAV